MGKDPNMAATCKDYAQDLIDGLGGAEAIHDADDPGAVLHEALEANMRGVEDSELSELADDARKHYRTEVDDGTLPRYEWPGDPQEYARELVDAIARAGIAAAVWFLVRQSKGDA
jgi:hypothetical protein